MYISLSFIGKKHAKDRIQIDCLKTPKHLMKTRCVQKDLHLLQAAAAPGTKQQLEHRFCWSLMTWKMKSWLVVIGILIFFANSHAIGFVSSPIYSHCSYAYNILAILAYLHLLWIQRICPMPQQPEPHQWPWPREGTCYTPIGPTIGSSKPFHGCITGASLRSCGEYHGNLRTRMPTSPKNKAFLRDHGGW